MEFSISIKRIGFALAEVLVTLGIIGVVAAITIPGLINNSKAARLRSQFLKSYSTVQQVFRQMGNDNEVLTHPASAIPTLRHRQITMTRQK